MEDLVIYKIDMHNVRAIVLMIVITVVIYLLAGCAVIRPESNGFAAYSFLANSKRIEVSKTGGSIDEANVSNPIGTTAMGVSAVVASGGMAGALP